ncbi:ribosomal protein S5 domain 2-type protein [Lipomyces japonicus]|uniref:ribosomal protein S5 domain 2-type protein n=1 Tax=Lipomyces japonicus TaxID=56871 RepID=UPI0034CE13F0
MSESLQDELLAIEAIYPSSVIQESSNIYIIHPPCLAPSSCAIQVSFPSSYPDAGHGPHVLSVNMPPGVKLVNGQAGGVQDPLRMARQVMAACFRPGEVCVFDFLDELAAVFEIDHEDEQKHSISHVTATTSAIDSSGSSSSNTVIMIQDNHADGDVVDYNILAPHSDDDDDHESINWVISDLVEDRKSKFEARAVEVHSVEQVVHNLSILKRQKKIARATHNIMAFRIQSSNLPYHVEDCDDDGESAAGGRLLHLLNLTDASNVLVVVSRWFGGIELGPDRFKHINNAARDSLVKGGFIESNSKKKNASDDKKKSKKSKK